MKAINPIQFGIKQNRIIAEGNQFNMVQYGSDNADEFLKFCFKIREKDATKSEEERLSYNKKVENQIIIEKENFNHSIYLAITDKKSENLVSTLVAVKKVIDKQIPTEKYFDLNLNDFCKSKNIKNENIWYYTRLTVDSVFFKNNNLQYQVSLATTKLLYSSIYEFAKPFFDIVFAEVTDYSQSYVNEKLGQSWKRITGEITSEFNKKLFAVYMTAADFDTWCEQVKNDFEIL